MADDEQEDRADALFHALADRTRRAIAVFRAAGRDYEPASELLARIRAERDNGAPEKPKANRRKRTPNAKSR